MKLFGGFGDPNHDPVPGFLYPDPGIFNGVFLIDKPAKNKTRKSSAEVRTF